MAGAKAILILRMDVVMRAAGGDNFVMVPVLRNLLVAGAAGKHAATVV